MNNAAEVIEPPSKHSIEIAEGIASVQRVLVDVMMAMKNGGVEPETISVAVTDLAGTLAGTQPDREVADRLAQVYAEARTLAENTYTKGEHHE